MDTKTADEVLAEQLAEMIDFIARSRWVRAKSMPTIPHEYVCKENLCPPDREKFMRFVIAIREHGFEATFFGKHYTYLQIDNFYYWTMGAPLGKTIILNRGSLDDYGVIEDENGELRMEGKH